MNLNLINSIFFLGIGGIGMSGLARYFMMKKYEVFGYDRESSIITSDLEKNGAVICHDIKNFDINYFYKNKDKTLVIYTPAVSENHPLFKKFKYHNFKIYKRAQVIEHISKDSRCIAIAGTHGKTTTSSILAHILHEANLSFCALVGGIMENYNSNFLFKGNEYFLIEADEFDRSFLHLRPEFACITSIDDDHMDIYENSNNLNEAFKNFAKNLIDGGFLISNDRVDIGGEKYGFESNSKFKVINTQHKSGFSQFDIQIDDNIIKNFKIKLPGEHNVLNCLAAVILALKLGVSESTILNAISTFKGVKRRFSYIINSEKIILIDDYAHHPEEISKIHKSLRIIYPNEKILAIFQPHLFSRTINLIDDFANELSKFDNVILLEIYPAREEPIGGVSSNLLLEKIRLDNKAICQKSEISHSILNIGNKINVLMGAGDIANEVELIKHEILKCNT